MLRLLGGLFEKFPYGSFKYINSGINTAKENTMDRKRHLMVIAVFVVIGLIGGLILGVSSDGIGAGLIMGLFLAVIGAIFGLGIVPWLAYIKEEWSIQIGHNGFSGSFIVWMLIKIMWATIRSPFVGIYQLASNNYG